MRTALLIIDIFNDFQFVKGDELKDETEKMIPSILLLKKFAKANRFPIIYINDNPFQDSLSIPTFLQKMTTKSNFQMIEQLKPNIQDIFLFKKKFSAFFQTELETYLAQLKIEQLILTGIAGHICVLFTANDAYMRGFQLVTPIDAYACPGPLQKDFTDAMFLHVFHSTVIPTKQWIQSQRKPLYNQIY